jgi:hypothetical protein
MFNVADNFTLLRESYSSSKFFFCLLKFSQKLGIKTAGGKMQPTFWLQYTLIGADAERMAWLP